LTQELLALERDPAGLERLTDLMRAAHSLKGAARIVGCDPAVRISHAIEDCFVAAQRKTIAIESAIDKVLLGVDLLTRIGEAVGPRLKSWVSDHANEIDTVVLSLEQMAKGSAPEAQATILASTSLTSSAPPQVEPAPVAETSNEIGQRIDDRKLQSVASSGSTPDRSLRVTADNLNRLLALAGEGLVASRWLASFVSQTRRIKELANKLESVANDFHDVLSERALDDRITHRYGQLRKKVTENRVAVSECVMDLDLFDRRFANLSSRLYQEIVDCRMRPFSDCVQGFPRLVRDLAKSLGKQAVLEIKGEGTLI
jgi:two-component system sensor histidine kinase and response regulator WspE